MTVLLYREEAGKEIRVVLMPVYEDYSGRKVEFLIGPVEEIYWTQFFKALLQRFCENVAKQ